MVTLDGFEFGTRSNFRVHTYGVHPLRVGQCFCVQNKIRYFFGYFDPEKIMRTNSFWGNLAHVLAKKETLVWA